MNIFEPSTRNPYTKPGTASTAGFMDLHHHFQSQLPEQVSHHRKIELQDPADLTYLIASVSQAAREKIDAMFAADATQTEGAGEKSLEETRKEQEEVRTKVEELVDQYITATFAHARQNLNINGMDAGELESELAKAREGEEIDAFDTKLARRVQTLAGEIEARTLQIANMRRTAPEEISKRFQDHFAKAQSESDAKLRQQEELDREDAKKVSVTINQMERQDELEKTWVQGNRGLVELKNELGKTVARMEKAQSTAEALTE